MGRLATLSFLAFTVGCQAVTGAFAVGAGGTDAGGGGGDSAGTSDAGTSDAGVAHDVSQDVSASEDAPIEAPACACVNDLSNVGLGDFAIAFTVSTTMHPTPPGYGALLNQRSVCSAGAPGWDVWLNSDGTVQIQVYDGSNDFDNVGTSKMVNDGQVHHVVLSRSSGGTVFNLDVDGTAVSAPNAAAMDLSGSLPALEQGVDPLCSGNEAQPSEPFVGSLEDVCIAVACVP